MEPTFLQQKQILEADVGGAAPSGPHVSGRGSLLRYGLCRQRLPWGALGLVPSLASAWRAWAGEEITQKGPWSWRTIPGLPPRGLQGVSWQESPRNVGGRAFISHGTETWPWCPGRVAQGEGVMSMHQKVVDSIPSPGTDVGRRFNTRPGCVASTKEGCFSLTSIFLSLSSSFPLSLEAINLSWGEKDPIKRSRGFVCT